MGKKKDKRLTSQRLDGKDYRDGALERLNNAWHLLETERFGDAIYLAGRAVEGMLRAVIWRRDRDVREGRKSLDTGHQLSELLQSVARLGLLRADGDRDQELRDSVQKIGRRWFNNMRFASGRFMHTLWWAQGVVTDRWTFKQAATSSTMPAPRSSNAVRNYDPRTVERDPDAAVKAAQSAVPPGR